MIEINKVSKKFKLNRKQYLTLKDVGIAFIKSKKIIDKSEVTIIENLSLSIDKGEVLGIVGCNGAGKSTLLKMISNVLQPDKGEIILKGSVAPLLEIGLGFNPELTGRENVYLYGSLLGKRKKEIDSIMESIIEFSELEDFIDSQVKTYSSGMQMRLAFSVATTVDADIIILDEVFSVGDAHFQNKSMSRMKQFKIDGKTMILVSHDLSLLKDFCDRILYIEKDGKYMIGGTDLIDRYLLENN